MQRMVVRIVFPPGLIAIMAAIAVRLPVWAFMMKAAAMRQVSPFDLDAGVLCNWDCEQFAALADDLQPSAFFPLFPALAGGLGIGGKAAVVFLANMCALLSGVLCLYLGRALWPDESWLAGFGKRAWLFFLSVSLYGYAHFWLRGYSEPLTFCLLAIGLLCLERRIMLGAGAAFGLAAISRPQGLLWAAGFSVVTLMLRVPGAWAASLLVASPVAGFLAWQYAATNNPLFFLRAQEAGWGRQLDIGEWVNSHMPTLNDGFAALVLSLGAAVWLLRQDSVVRRTIAAGTLLSCEVPLLMGGMYSYSRFMSLSIGMFMVLTELGARWTTFAVIWGVYSVTRLAMSTYASAFNFWVG